MSFIFGLIGMGFASMGFFYGRSSLDEIKEMNIKKNELEVSVKNVNIKRSMT